MQGVVGEKHRKQHEAQHQKAQEKGAVAGGLNRHQEE
jgi:hypothetical protein